METIRKPKTIQTALMEGVDDKVGYWLTPPDLLDKLNAEFQFDYDPCPYPRPAGFNGLVEDWGESTWCNPPICKGSSLSAWIDKAIAESRKGKQVVMILPLPRWFRKLTSANAEIRSLGPVHFLDPRGRRCPSEGGGRYPDTLFILDGKTDAQYHKR